MIKPASGYCPSVLPLNGSNECNIHSFPEALILNTVPPRWVPPDSCSSIEVASAVHDQTRCRILRIGSAIWAKRIQNRLRARGTDLGHCTGVVDPATIRSSVEIASAVHDQTRYRQIPIDSYIWAKRMQDRLCARGTDLEHCAVTVG